MALAVNPARKQNSVMAPDGLCIVSMQSGSPFRNLDLSN
jgi:hypothetical protein